MLKSCLRGVFALYSMNSSSTGQLLSKSVTQNCSPQFIHNKKSLGLRLNGRHNFVQLRYVVVYVEVLMLGLCLAEKKAWSCLLHRWRPIIINGVAICFG